MIRQRPEQVTKHQGRNKASIKVPSIRWGDSDDPWSRFGEGVRRMVNLGCHSHQVCCHCYCPPFCKRWSLYWSLSDHKNNFPLLPCPIDNFFKQKTVGLPVCFRGNMPKKEVFNYTTSLTQTRNQEVLQLKKLPKLIWNWVAKSFDQCVPVGCQ